MKNSLFFNIANFQIRLNSELRLQYEPGYRHFVTAPFTNPDVIIECRKMEGDNILDGAEKVFTSADDDKKFYDVYRKNELLLFVIHNQEKQDKIQQYAQLEPDMKNWTVWSEEIDGALLPMVYPLGPILLHYVVLNSDAVMMHASGVFDGEIGRMFSGFSGAGKSTISGIWRDAGNLMLNDDRLIIRREDGKYFMYNTPMFYEDDNKKSSLESVYLIYHSPDNRIEKLSGAAAVSRIMAFSIQNNYDQRFVQHHLDFFSKMSETIPIYRLGFGPDLHVIDFIKEYAI